MNASSNIYPVDWPIQDVGSTDQHQNNFPAITDQDIHAWWSNEIRAFCIPFTSIIFNHNPEFKKLLDDAGTDFNLALPTLGNHHAFIDCCCLILNKYYNAGLDTDKNQFYEIPTITGIKKYYRVSYNTDLLKIIPTDKAVPVTNTHILELINNYDDLDRWKQLFPPGSWQMKGAAIITLTDITEVIAASLFKEKLLALKTDNFKDTVAGIFRSILNVPGIDTGLTLVNEMTGKLYPAVFGQQILSIIVPHGSASVDMKQLCRLTYQCLMIDRNYFAVSDVPAFFRNHPDSHVARVFTQAGINSFILVPIVKSGKLLGILEVVSREPNTLNSLNARKLDIVLSFLPDGVERLLTRFHMQAEAVIQEHYTAVHPSVKWRFLHEAERYLFQRELGRNYQLGDIVLRDVYPLFGQTDIKGSGHQRNECIKKDLTTQLLALISLLNSTETLRTEVPVIEKWLGELSLSFNASSEKALGLYLETYLNPLLSKTADIDTLKEIHHYLHEAHNRQGVYFEHRRRYQQTVEMINNNLSRILVDEQLPAQQIIPHYFDYFKTDGIEYLLYAGSSILSQHSFDLRQLSALRSWQVHTLCLMARAHARIKPELPYPLDVTSLLLSYETPMTVRFRMDEKRLDADGTYNIAFEIIRKRLDKALVKNTGERLTQPGKLVIVYTSDAEFIEYKHYLSTLQQQGMLEMDVEQLWVDDLQDVSGLRALRVTIAV